MIIPPGLFIGSGPSSPLINICLYTSSDLGIKALGNEVDHLIHLQTMKSSYENILLKGFQRPFIIALKRQKSGLCAQLSAQKPVASFAFCQWACSHHCRTGPLSSSTRHQPLLQIYPGYQGCISVLQAHTKHVTWQGGVMQQLRTQFMDSDSCSRISAASTLSRCMTLGNDSLSVLELPHM